MGPLPLGLIASCRSVEILREKFIPLRRFFRLKKVDVIGVSGGEEGLACWERLKSGVVGRIAIVSRARIKSYSLVGFFLRVELKASAPVVGISSREKADEEDCRS